MLSDLLREHLISHDDDDCGGGGDPGLTTAGSDQLERGLTLKLPSPDVKTNSGFLRNVECSGVVGSGIEGASSHSGCWNTAERVEGSLKYFLARRGF